MTAAFEHEFPLPQGRLCGQIAGPEDGPLALLVPGLTANRVSMELIARALAEAGWRAIALDLRGRGRSETTSAGTYGWDRHAQDLIELAGRVGAERFAVVGWSMGAFVAQQTAVMVPERVSHLALIDAAGPPRPESVGPVMAAVERLRDVYPSADAYVERVRSIGTMTPWTETWDRYLRYELVEVEGGVRSRTSHDAVLEDIRYAAGHDPSRFWPELRGPVLLVRATRPFLPSLPEAVIVPGRAVPEFQARVRGASVVEVDRNHYGVVLSPETATAVSEAFTAGPGRD